MKTIDPRIAAYIAEVDQPGIPYVSFSHVTLMRLYAEHGAKVIDALLDAHFRRMPMLRCEPCNATGAIHCADPANCGGPWDDHVGN